MAKDVGPTAHEITPSELRGLTQLIAICRTLGGVQLQIGYSGEGDDGCIDEFTLTAENGSSIKLVESMRARFYELMDDDLVGGDYSNNDGGNGSIDIDLIAGKVTIEFNARIESYNTTTRVFDASNLTEATIIEHIASED